VDVIFCFSERQTFF